MSIPVVTRKNDRELRKRNQSRGQPIGWFENNFSTGDNNRKHDRESVKIGYYRYDAYGRKANEVAVGLCTNSFTYSPAEDLLTLKDGKSQQTSWKKKSQSVVTSTATSTLPGGLYKSHIPRCLYG